MKKKPYSFIKFTVLFFFGTIGLFAIGPPDTSKQHLPIFSTSFGG